MAERFRFTFSILEAQLRNSNMERETLNFDLPNVELHTFLSSTSTLLFKLERRISDREVLVQSP
jgi:hypothetical protein